MAYRNYRRTTEPRSMTARYAGKCASCSCDIKAGDTMVWVASGRKAYCSEHGQPLLYGAAREASYERYGTDVMADY